MSACRVHGEAVPPLQPCPHRPRVPSPPQPALEDGEGKEVARITFVFETVCSVSCELYFMVVSDGGGGWLGWGGIEECSPCHPSQGINSRTNTPVETWTGPRGKQSYTYVVEKNATTSFTWAFQRTRYREAVSGGTGMGTAASPSSPPLPSPTQHQMMLTASPGPALHQ